MRDSQYNGIMAVLWGILASLQPGASWFAIIAWIGMGLFSVFYVINWRLEQLD